MPLRAPSLSHRSVGTSPHASPFETRMIVRTISSHKLKGSNLEYDRSKEEDERGDERTSCLVLPNMGLLSVLAVRFYDLDLR